GVATLRMRTTTPRSTSAEKNGPQSIGLWRHPSRGSCKPPALALGWLTGVTFLLSGQAFSGGLPVIHVVSGRAGEEGCDQTYVGIALWENAVRWRGTGDVQSRYMCVPSLLRCMRQFGEACRWVQRVLIALDQQQRMRGNIGNRPYRAQCCDVHAEEHPRGK